MSITGVTLMVLWLAGLGVLFGYSLIPNAGLSSFVPGSGFDKIARFLVFAAFAFVPAAFFESVRYGLLAASCVAPFGFVIEFLQRGISGRNFSPEDIISNNLGTLLGIGLAVGWRLVRFRRQAMQGPAGKEEGAEGAGTPGSPGSEAVG